MVTRVINILYREVRGLHQAAYVVALFTLASQLLAVVRDRILAHQFGAGIELDIYYTAFRIPDLLYVLFASVLSVYVLLPFVTKARQKSQSDGGLVLAQMFTIFLYSYIGVSALVYMFAPVLVPTLFPGFAHESYDDIVQLMRLLLLQPLFLGVSSLFGVVTQIHHRFVLYALSPLLYNIGIICGVVVFYPLFGVSGLAWGVVLGAFGHMIVQWPLVRRSDLAFGVVHNIDWKILLAVFKVALPRAITLSLGQIQFMVFVTLASFMTVGSVAVLQLSYNLQSVPLAIVGMSYSVAAFPVLADLLAKQERAKFAAYVTTALRHIIFWALPITALIIVLRAQIVRVLLGSGSFNWDDTRLTAAALAIFVIALVGQAILLLIVRAFYAGGYTKTPLWVTLIGATCGISAAYLLTVWYTTSASFAALVADLLRLEGVTGVEVLMLPIGFVLGVLLEVAILLFIFMRSFPLPGHELSYTTMRAFVAASVGSLATYVALAFVVEGVNQERFIGIFIQGVTGGFWGVSGVVITYALLGSPELGELTKSFKARIFKTDVVAPQPDIL